jgi:hypothetical protein
MICSAVAAMSFAMHANLDPVQRLSRAEFLRFFSKLRATLGGTCDPSTYRIVSLRSRSSLKLGTPYKPLATTL